VFVVWSDQVGGREGHVPDAMALLSDPRVRHYWDGDRRVGRAFRVLDLGDREIDLETDAWDVWLLFDEDVTWEADTPPRPAWWEHQLRIPVPERTLDAARFARKANELR
jgi:hypothetical protein